METVFDKIIFALTQNNIHYNLIHHAPCRTSSESALQRGDSEECGAKAIVVKVKQEFNLLVLRAYLKLNIPIIQEIFSVKKVRLATSEELYNLTGLVPGSVPPFGYPILPLPLYIDTSIKNGHDLIGFNAGVLTSSIKMSKEDYLRIAQGKVLSFSSFKDC